MNKYCFVLSRSIPTISIKQFNAQLIASLPEKLQSISIVRFSLNLVDEYVQPAAPLLIQNQVPPIEAVVFIWSDKSQVDDVCSAVENYAKVLSVYHLQEYEPLHELKKERDGKGSRTSGFMQLAFLKVPNWLSYEQWRSIWQDEHTQVAIEIQSTFIYRQNPIIECISAEDIGFSAIVEEAFPENAMASQSKFYATKCDTELKQRQKTMWQSSQRFIDMNELTVIPTSEYCW